MPSGSPFIDTGPSPTNGEQPSQSNRSPSSGSTPTGTGPADQSIRSPSPKKPPSGASNLLGLGLPSPSSQSSQSSQSSSLPSVITLYPHLAHYIFNLLSTASTSPPRGVAPVHPLSVSSSGESDGSDDEAHGGESSLETAQKTPQKKRANGSQATDRDGLVRIIVKLLDNEEEEEVKVVLKPFMGDLAKDEILMDQVCLDCMHRRRDDVEGLPYQPHFTPSRARASPSLNSVPHRPFTPTRLPSFRARTPIGRPQSPSVPSGAQTPTGAHPSSSLARSDSGLSPTVASISLPSSSGYSSSGSPVASPGMLNAKAATFNPSPRPSPRAVSAPMSAASTTASTPFSPSDPWKDAPAEAPRSASPFGPVAPPAMARTGSNLAIAAPLFSDQSSPFHSPIGTPNRGTIKMPDVFSSSPGLPSLPRSASRGIIPDDDDDDEFSPFGSGLPKLHHYGSGFLNTGAKAFEPSETQWGSATTSSSSIPNSDSYHSYDSFLTGANSSFAQEPPAEDDAGAGMTPLDVLASVFSTVPRSELEDALHRSAYDFEGAMALLVSSYARPRSGSSTPQRISSPRPLLGVGSRGALPLGHAAPRDGYFQQGGRTFNGNMSPGLGGTRSPGGGATRMCRYFLAGECRRSDCRFSHDLDRALCRFWLRGHCAKGPNCEFLHQFPNGFDPHDLSNAISRLELGNDGSAHHSPVGGHSSQIPDDFPDLLAGRLGRPVGRFDPTRNRFANAVKRAPGAIAMPTLQVTGSRQAPLRNASGGPYSPNPESARTTALAVPRPSQRIKLRPPTLLPTVRTGTAANEQYMSTRATAIRLGQARNGCLARAADAFRRGDGAAAKRFSREGKALNQRMLDEAAEAAQILVRERQRDVQLAVRERDTNWSDDPSDRAERGKDCGAGLGVVMGVAGKRNVPGGERLSAQERMEALVDLHTLHGSEGADILGAFLEGLERESYRGLAYILVGEEKHVGLQDPLRGASKVRLGASIKQCLADWGYPWNETAGVLCVDPCRY